MQIANRVIGTIEYDESNIVRFPEGIPAFREEKEFIIISLEENGPFYYLQSIHSELCLVAVDPFYFFPDYCIDVPDEKLKMLGEEISRESLVVYAILTIPDDFREATANLVAPVIVNASEKLGLQFIPEKTDYTTKHKIFKTIAPSGAVVQEAR